MHTDLTSRPVSGHPHSHSTALSPFPSPSLTSSPIRLSSSVDDGKLISICFAAISVAAALWPRRQRRQPIELRLPPSLAFLLSCQPLPARSPGTRSMFSKDFSPVGDIAMKVFPGCSAAHYALYPVWAALSEFIFRRAWTLWHWEFFFFPQQKHAAMQTLFWRQNSSGSFICILKWTCRPKPLKVGAQL